MPTPMTPNAPPNPSDAQGVTPDQGVTPVQLANQLFNAALAQYSDKPREAAHQVVAFLTEALIYSISGSTTDEAARKVLFKSVGDTIAAAAPR
jgi:hypothetical protein